MNPPPRSTNPNLQGNVPPNRKDPDPVPRPFPLPKAVLAVVAAAAILGSSYWLSRPSGDAAETQDQIQQELVAFSHLQADFPVVDVHNPEQRAKAKEALTVPAPEAETLLDRAAKGEVRLVWVTVWDNREEDGDTITVSAGNVTTPVIVLAHAKRTIVLPVAPGEAIRITGVKDGGGGGITTGIVTASGEISVPPLYPGQVVTLSVR